MGAITQVRATQTHETIDSDAASSCIADMHEKIPTYAEKEKLRGMLTGVENEPLSFWITNNT